MTLALAALAVIGLLIFLINFGRIIIASFKHHIVTGLISLVPGINIVVLPTIWARIGNAFVMSIIGLILAAGGWILGGKTAIHHLLSPTNTVTTSNSLPALNPAQPSSITTPTISSPSVTDLDQNVKYKELPLPRKPLYRLHFQEIDINQTPVNLNQQLKVTLKDGSIHEGRLVEPINQAITLNKRPNLPTHRIELQHILKVEQLIKINL